MREFDQASIVSLVPASKADEAITIAGGVAALALSATWEIAALLHAIIEQSPMLSEDQRPLLVRGMALRAASLNGALMGLLGDDMARTDDEALPRLQRLVLGGVST